MKFHRPVNYDLPSHLAGICRSDRFKEAARRVGKSPEQFQLEYAGRSHSQLLSAPQVAGRSLLFAAPAVRDLYSSDSNGYLRRFNSRSFLMTLYLIDADARVAALEAVEAVRAVYDRSPRLSPEERDAVLIAKFAEARHDLVCYIPAEADAAFSRAIAYTRTVLGGASSGGDVDDFGLSPKAAAELLISRRSGQ
jgi:hypothetical protein